MKRSRDDGGLNGILHHVAQITNNLNARNVLSQLVHHQFVLLQGVAGTGKSHTIHGVVDALSTANIETLVLTPTGVAAVNLSSTGVFAKTIHSGLGIGINAQMYHARGKTVQSNISSVDVVIIDEIGMVGAILFELIAYTFAFKDVPDHDYQAKQAIFSAQKVATGSAWGFGTHTKFIFVGDFMQLPPIKDIYCFQSPFWPAPCRMAYLRLRHNFRQVYDKSFANQLMLVRRCKYDKVNRNLFDQRVIEAPVSITRIFSRNYSVDSYNTRCMNSLPSQLHTSHAYTAPYVSKPNGTYNETASMKIYKSAVYQSQRSEGYNLDKTPVNNKLHLKIGAVVMLRKNNIIDHAANGSVGVITEVYPPTCARPINIDERPRSAREYARYFKSIVSSFYSVAVDFGGNIGQHHIRCNNFQIELAHSVMVDVYQLPLIIAFAITTHKSQSTTMNAAVIDPDGRNPNQLYVALSRVTSFDGLYLTRKLPRTWARASDAVVNMECDKGMLYMCMAMKNITSPINDIKNCMREIADFL